jgi:hypothetical protein
MLEDPEKQDLNAFSHITTTAEERFFSKFLGFRHPKETRSFEAS